MENPFARICPSRRVKRTDPLSMDDIHQLRMEHKQKQFDDEIDRIILVFNDQVIIEKRPKVAILLPGRNADILHQVELRMKESNSHHYVQFMPTYEQIIGKGIHVGDEDHYRGPDCRDGRTYLVFIPYST